jgi:hypothetical protein
MLGSPAEAGPLKLPPIAQSRGQRDLLYDGLHALVAGDLKGGCLTCSFGRNKKLFFSVLSCENAWFAIEILMPERSKI